MTAAIDLHNEEATLFRDMIGRFCEAEVDPFYDQWERDEILPRDIWHKLGAAGFLCVDIPEAYGGTSEIMQELVARAVLDSWKARVPTDSRRQ